MYAWTKVVILHQLMVSCKLERYSVIVNYKCRVPSPVNLLWNFRRFYVACKKSKCRKKNKTDSEKGNKSSQDMIKPYNWMHGYNINT